MRIDVPRGLRSSRPPVLVAFHGAGGDGDFMAVYTGITREGAPRGFVTVYPDSGSDRRWHFRPAERKRAGDDVPWASALLDTIADSGCINIRRISTAGVSNGAGMAAALACRSGTRLAASVLVSGGYSGLGPCSVAHPISILEIHGTADPVVPYRGLPPDYGGDVMRFVRSWVTYDHCDHRRRVTYPYARVTSFDWSGCAARARVRHMRVHGGTHQWEGSDIPDHGPTPTFSATRRALAFVRSARAPAP